MEGLEAGKPNSGKKWTGWGPGKWTLGILEKRLPERELQQKVIPKEGLKRIELAVGRKDVKAAN